MSYIFFKFAIGSEIDKPSCKINIYSDECLISPNFNEFTRSNTPNEKWLVFSEDGELLENTFKNNMYYEQVPPEILKKWVAKIVCAFISMGYFNSKKTLAIIDDFIISSSVLINIDDDFSNFFVSKIANEKCRRCEPWECFQISCILNGIDNETSEYGAKAMRDCFQNDWPAPLQNVVGSSSIYQMVSLAIEYPKYANEYWRYLINTSGNTNYTSSCIEYVSQSAIVNYVLHDACNKLRELGFYVDICDKAFVNNEELGFHAMSLHVGNDALDVVWAKNALEIGSKSIDQACHNGDFEKLSLELKVDEESKLLSEQYSLEWRN